jgi:hypothetical protein
MNTTQFDERNAWLEMARLLRKHCTPEKNGSYDESGRFLGLGLCCIVKDFYNYGKVDLKRKEKMCSRLMKIANSRDSFPYAWPVGDYKSRIRYCIAQARRLK